MNSVVNLDIAKRVDVICRKGDTLTLSLNITDTSGNAQDLTAYTGFKMEVRKADYKNTAYSNDGDNNDNIILSTEDPDAGTEDKRVSYVADANGNLVFTVAASVMGTRPAGMYVYDIESIDAGGTVQTWIYGTFRINEDVSV